MSEGRFSNLEIDGQSASGTRRAPAEHREGRARGHFVAVRDAEHYLEKATGHTLDGDHDEALRAYAAGLGENPLLLEAWRGQVRMLLELEEYPEAILWADKAAEKFPDNPELLALKSVALYRMGQRREARDMNDRALEMKGEFEIVWLARGEQFLGDDRPTHKECFQHAERLAKDRGLALLSIGALYLRYGHHGEALATLGEASRTLPRSAWAWYQLGRVHAALGDYQHAQISFGEAHRLNAENETYLAAVQAAPTGFVDRLAELLRRWLGR